MKRSLLILFVLALTFLSFTSWAITKIRFGVISFYPPFVFSSKSGYIHGFDIEVANAICQQLKTQCVFIPLSLSSLFQQLTDNQVDAIMGAISITAQRQKQFDFTQPYFKSSMVYVTLSSNNIDSNNLRGKKIGAVKDSTFFSYLTTKYGSSIILKSFVTNEALFNALSNHLVDIVLIDSPAAQYWVDYSAGLFRTIGTPTYLPFDQGYGITVRQGSPELLKELNTSLTALGNSNILKKLINTYFNK